MIDDIQLSKKLAALSGDDHFENGAMRLGAGGDKMALGLILEAIDNTVLPRKLTFSVDGASVTLAVGGRRLSALLETSGPVAGGEKLIGQLLSQSDTDEISALGQLLGDLVERSGAILLTREGAEGRGGQSDTGVAIATLVELWGVDPFAQDLPRLEKITRSLDGVLLAHSKIEDDQLADPQGDAAMIKALGAALASDLPATVAAFDEIHQDNSIERCITLEHILPDGALFSFLSIDNDVIVLATVSDSWFRVSRAWSIG